MSYENTAPAVYQLLNDLNDQLRIIALENNSPFARAKKSIPVCSSAVKKLKKLIIRTHFRYKADEIHFFKEIKPQFASRLIYHISVYNIEIDKPHGCNKVQRKYFSKELHYIKWFFDHNRELFKYYRGGGTHLDTKYFLRNRHDINLTLEGTTFEYDAQFCTSHDTQVSRLLANELLRIYLEEEIARIDNLPYAQRHVRQEKSKFNWTSSKTALVELIYGLQAAQCINNGNIEITELARAFENLFNIELKDYYRKFIEIKDRKSSPAKFLDHVKSSLISRLREEDE